jgi:spoIIIJ-associated protein
MAGFFSKLFGGKSKSGGEVETLVNDTLAGIIEKGQFDLSYKISYEKEADSEGVLSIEFSGSDEELLKDKKGQMLDAFQLFLKRVVQHNFRKIKQISLWTVVDTVTNLRRL